MPKDAKLGLVVGVALVIAVAVVFFRRDGSGHLAIVTEPQAGARVEQTPRPPAAREASPPVNQVTAGGSAQATPAHPKVHVIRSGDTLYTIAQEHYGDGERFYEVYQANRDVLKSPDGLPLGSSLRIP